eukprot:GABW01002355.1.p1 GENE.GABW01002355.1~~GABW01002355.1.p1  ORF type:complete len:57 (+),score=7.93 GABW01002355.1:79-249(+)
MVSVSKMHHHQIGLDMYVSGHKWFTQRWSDKCHSCIGREYPGSDTLIPMLDHFYIL